MKRVIGLASVLVVALVLQRGPSVRAATHTGASRMSIQILSPKGPITVPENGKIPFRLAIKGMKLNLGAMGRKSVAGEGHYHFYLDCIPPAAYTEPHNFGNCWAGAAASLTPVFDLATSQVKVPPGTHNILVALAQNNHVLYRAPPAVLSITVVKRNARPMSIQILSPKGPITVAKNGKIPFRLAIKGMKLNLGAMGRKSVAGEGHYHFYLDCIPPASYTKPRNFGNCWAGAAASLTPVFDLSTSQVKVSPGPHILLVALAQNNHVLYMADAATLVFTVTG